MKKIVNFLSLSIFAFIALFASQSYAMNIVNNTSSDIYPYFIKVSTGTRTKSPFPINAHSTRSLTTSVVYYLCGYFSDSATDCTIAFNVNNIDEATAVITYKSNNFYLKDDVQYAAGAHYKAKPDTAGSLLDQIEIDSTQNNGLKIFKLF